MTLQDTMPPAGRSLAKIRTYDGDAVPFRMTVQRLDHVPAHFRGRLAVLIEQQNPRLTLSRQPPHPLVEGGPDSKIDGIRHQLPAMSGKHRRQSLLHGCTGSIVHDDRLRIQTRQCPIYGIQTELQKITDPVIDNNYGKDDERKVKSLWAAIHLHKRTIH